MGRGKMTHEGMFPAPKAWTPLEERQKANRTKRRRRMDLLLGIVDEGR